MGFLDRFLNKTAEKPEEKKEEIDVNMARESVKEPEAPETVDELNEDETRKIEELKKATETDKDLRADFSRAEKQEDDEEKE